MKKRIFISVTCIAVAVIYVDAQNKSSISSIPETAVENFVAAPPTPPPPPVPPVPPEPPLPPLTDVIELPLPPAPPVPPVPASAVSIPDFPDFYGPEIINNNGNEISIRTINGKTMVIVHQEGKTQRIKLSTWNANRKYYEKKYGQLPAPPPPATLMEEVEFNPPVIKKDN